MKKNILNFVFPLIFIFILTFSFYLHYNLRYYLRFGDEIGHYYGGYLVSQGKRLYKDIQLNHQPLPYLYSSLINKITISENLYKYIGIQRMSIFLYSAFWISILFLFFGKKALIFAFIFEFIKFSFLGYQNLGETFAVYPLVFLIMDLSENYLYKKSSVIKTLIYSLANFLVFTSLLPLWPVIGILYLVKITIIDKRQKIILIISTTILTLLSLIFYSYFDLIRETVIYNIKYFLPSFDNKINIFDFILFPFSSFLPPYNKIKIITSLLVIMFLYALYFGFKKDKKLFLYTIFLTLIIYLTNLRDPTIQSIGFPKFHLLPWVGLFISINSFLIIYILEKNKSLVAKILLFLMIIINFCSIISNDIFFFKKRDFINDFYINYSQTETYGRIINILKDKNDKLLVIPNDPLVYYLTNIYPPTRVLEYYLWVQKIPTEKDSLLKFFKNTPPEFVVDTGLNENNFLEKYVIDNLNKNYVNLKHLNKKSKLYIYKDKIKEINEKQKEEMSNLLFSF